MKFTEQQINNWKKFERVRKSGRFNMIMEAASAMARAGLHSSEYFFVMENFDALEKAAIKEVK